MKICLALPPIHRKYKAIYAFQKSKISGSGGSIAWHPSTYTTPNGSGFSGGRSEGFGFEHVCTKRISYGSDIGKACQPNLGAYSCNEGRGEG